MQLVLAAAEAAEKSHTLFYVVGGLLAAWAVVVSAMGIMQPAFPKNAGQQNGVIAISVVLVVAAMASAVIVTS